MDPGVALGQGGRVHPVRGRRAAVQQAGGREDERAGAEPDDPRALVVRLAQCGDRLDRRRLRDRAPGRHHDRARPGERLQPVRRGEREAAGGGERPFLPGADQQAVARDPGVLAVDAEDGERDRALEDRGAAEDQYGDGLGVAAGRTASGARRPSRRPRSRSHLVRRRLRDRPGRGPARPVRADRPRRGCRAAARHAPGRQARGQGDGRGAAGVDGEPRVLAALTVARSAVLAVVLAVARSARMAGKRLAGVAARPAAVGGRRIDGRSTDGPSTLLRGHRKARRSGGTGCRGGR